MRCSRKRPDRFRWTGSAFIPSVVRGEVGHGNIIPCTLDIGRATCTSSSEPDILHHKRQGVFRLAPVQPNDRCVPAFALEDTTLDGAQEVHA